MKYLFVFFSLFISLTCCNAKSPTSQPDKQPNTVTTFDSTYKVIHVMVALCDNKYQGIVPVPKKIGNGQDPDNNLYWGCGYGMML